MGFFKKLFTLGGRRNKKKTEEFSTMPYVQAATLPLPPSKRDSDAAISRLLRSSSAHFTSAMKNDYSTLPPIPHSLNTLSSASLASPSRSPSIMTKNSYSVTVLQRVKHSETEFPNAYPALEDGSLSSEKVERQLYHEHKSTPNLHDFKRKVATESRQRQSSDPSEVPFTPRDTNRLQRLRQDPSVVSLLNMYDEKGRLDDKAFSNTPQASKKQRESTFKELLALGDDSLNDAKYPYDGEGEGDFSWAERFIAESNRSSSSLSTISSPPVTTPTLPIIQGVKEADSTFATNSSGAHPTISSLEVELSMVADEEDGQTVTSETPEKNSISQLMSPQRVTRTPSKRASQVFNFITEKRERKKSQSVGDLFLASSTAEKSSQELQSPHNDAHCNAMIIPTIFVDEYKTNSSIDPDVTTVVPADPLSSIQLAALRLPMPAPVSPFVIHGLPAPPRGKSRSTGAADSLKLQQRLDERENAFQQTRSGRIGYSMALGGRERPSRAVRGSTGAQVLLGGERERLRETEKQRESEKEKMGLVRGPRPLPAAPMSFTAGGAKLQRQGSHLPIRRESRPVFGEISNGLHQSRIPNRPPSRDGRVRSKVYKEGSRSNGAEDTDYISRPRRLGSFSRGNERPEIGRRSSRTSVSLAAPSELTRSSTTSRIEPVRPVSVAIDGPMTPARSRSLAEAPSPASSSELSPEAKQLMADLRAKRMRARYANSQREAEAQNRVKGSEGRLVGVY